MLALKHNLTVNDTTLTLCFCKIAGCRQTKFVVEVLHENRLVTVFDMVKEEGQGWTILPPVRDWVLLQKQRLAWLANRALCNQSGAAEATPDASPNGFLFTD